MNRDLDHSVSQVDHSEGTRLDKTEQALEMADQIFTLSAGLRKTLKEMKEQTEEKSANRRLSLLLGGKGGGAEKE